MLEYILFNIGLAIVVAGAVMGILMIIEIAKIAIKNKRKVNK